jgi:adenosylhomocysteine nucleosidase
MAESTSAPAPGPRPLLVCFAVKEEAKFFKPPPGVRVILTGMGRRNAFEALDKFLAKETPSGVISCGFAGGLNPTLEIGSIVFDMDEGAPWEKAAMASNAKLAKFHCANRVAITATEKHKLWQVTGADGVEMESDTIREMSRRKGIPSATIRSISDTAHQNLPLDFNRLMTPDNRIDFAKLAARLILAPRKVAELLRFESQTITAAQSLATFLEKLLSSR